jgi:Ca2+-binding RTX toxin-like protein
LQGFSWDGGGDYDTLRISGSLDLTGKTVTLTSVDEIYLDVGASGAGTLTISSTTFNTNPIFNLRGTSGTADTLIVQGLAAADTINANLVSVESSFAALKINGLAGNDTITGSAWADIIDGGTGNDLLSGGNGGDTYIFNSGDVDVGETIVESSTGTGTDSFSVVTSTDFRNMVASSFDEVETISLAAGLTAKFTGLQLTGESIAISGTPGSVESVEVYVGVGEQFSSGLTDATGSINNTYLIGSTGDETIAGGAMTEFITGGTGNDVLSGGAGNDTYIFELAATNGIDRITFGVLDGTAIDDKLDMSINVFLGDGTPDIGIITETNTATTLTSNVAGDNILILRNAYYADAAALSLSTMLFAASFPAAGKVVFIYASSATADARMAIATISDPGNVSAAVDVAVLVGITVTEAASGFATTSFSL